MPVLVILGASTLELELNGDDVSSRCQHINVTLDHVGNKSKLCPDRERILPNECDVSRCVILSVLYAIVYYCIYIYLFVTSLDSFL